MRLYFLSMLCLSVSACAPTGIPIFITPTPGTSTDAKPTSDVMNVAAVTPRDGAGAIVVTRDKGWVGRGCTYDVSLDDQHVAGLRPGEQVTLYADPGERIVGISIRRDGTCDPAFAQVSVQAVAHATKKVRVGADASYDLVVESSSHGGSLPP